MEENMKFVPNPAEVEKKLNAIQRELAPSESRNSLFNLVIFSYYGKKETSEKALSYLLGKRPARIIHIHLNYPKETVTDISGRCVEDYENRGVCFEEIVIFSGPDKTGEDPGSWSPLLIRDIPTFLWWEPEVSKLPELLLRAESFADKLIIKSGAGDLDFYSHLIQEIRQNSLCLADLTWQQLIPYIKLTARLFNPEEDLDSLYDIKEVNLQGFPREQAILYLAWLGSKLNWVATNLEGDSLSLTRGNTSLKFNIGHTGSPLISFALHSGPAYKIVSKENSGVVDLIRGEKGSYEVSHTPVDYGEVILQEVDKMYSDSLFFDSLQWIKENL